MSWELKLIIKAHSREDLERRLKEFTSTASIQPGNWSNQVVSCTVTAPTELPLTNTELRRLRALIK